MFNRVQIIGLLSVFALVVTAAHSTIVAVPAESAQAAFGQCEDGLDNDNDGFIDYPQDPGCKSLHDDSEGASGNGLFLSLSDGLNEIKPNGHATYSIGLRTERDEEKIVDVRFQMPHQTNLISASDGGHREGDLIVWRNVSVYPGRLRNLYVNINVSPDAEEDLLLVAEATAEKERATDTTRVEEADEVNGRNALSRLNVSISDNRTYAEPSELLKYAVSVRNPTNKAVNYTLRVSRPTDTTLTYVSGEHSADRQAIVWEERTINPGAAHEYEVHARIDNNSKDFYNITTRASVGSVSNTDTTTIHAGVLPSAILVHTTDGLEEVVPGALVTYDIHLENISAQLATEVDVQNALPSYMEFVDAAEGGYWNGKLVRWDNLTVAPNGTRHLRVTGRVRSDAPAGHSLRNAVSVKGFEAADVTLVGERVSGAGVAQGKQVLVNKYADRSEVRPGDTVSYTVSIQNVTNHALTNIRVEDRMDSQYVRILKADSGQLSRNRILWNIPSLAPGERWEVRYSVQVGHNAPHGVTIPNIVTVSGEGMDTLSLTERIHTLEIGVISNLPPTGAAFDAIFLALSSLLGGIPTLLFRRRLLA